MLLGGRFRTSLTDWLICFETAAVSRSQYVERKKRWREREKELLDLRRNNLPSATRPGNLDFNGNMFTSRTWPSWKSHIWIAYFIFSREWSPSSHRESLEGCWFPKKNKDQAFPYKHFFLQTIPVCLLLTARHEVRSVIYPTTVCCCTCRSS